MKDKKVVIKKITLHTIMKLCNHVIVRIKIKFYKKYNYFFIEKHKRAILRKYHILNFVF